MKTTNSKGPITQSDIDRYNKTRSLDDPNTYWNGEECAVKEVDVIVADAPEFPYYWARKFVGQSRKALKILAPGAEPFYIDNEDGEGMRKVTEGKGMWTYSHKSLTILQEIK